ncbi:phosphoenolpyruvate--protein phosphotransferase [Govanella unica]|uniref:Phosphoenolpyruvate-protein phosphotransferase n=1 Tax=Govanella unica TaxID=2975056 RepID=A0A9X3Z7Z8_9PROT|nr:phosphoenolpyruvate--protein phosphotransferase [Govania unica]MDA5194568.1 phosphoenolpyruvate--protein phosphotransferase [Govania unica]
MARTPAQNQREQRIKGVGVSYGAALGTAYVIERGALRVPEYVIAPDDVAAECARFGAAVAEAQQQLETLQQKAVQLTGLAAEEFGILLDAHHHMLAGSRLTRSVRAIIGSEFINSEAAVVQSLDQIEEDFRAIDDPYIAARITDVREVGTRLLRNLMGKTASGFEHVPAGSVIIADEITPADTALMMDRSRIGGFAAMQGGAEGHTAIMARSLGLPSVLGAPGLVEDIRTGDFVIIDGENGMVIVHPTEDTLSHYTGKQAAFAAETAHLATLRDLPAETLNGEKVTLKANMELPSELAVLMGVGAEGVGLLRSEFLFMNRPDLPGEDEQYEILRTILEGLNGTELTVRTLDVGADKLTPQFGDIKMSDPNPALGLRAIRFSLKMRGLLENQLCAILRAACHGPVRILLPMITTCEEVMLVREILVDMMRKLKRRGEDLPEKLPPLGVMIEVPAAALAADALAQVSDFFSIGTNDLTMYTLAIDRGNEQVAHLYDPLHLAVLRLIQFSTEAAKRAGIPVNLCGEIAGDDRYTALLIGLGLRELSMVPLALPRIKRRIRGLDSAVVTRLATEIMAMTDARAIARTLTAFNRDLEQQSTGS